MYKSVKWPAGGYYHGQMNGENFEKWMKEKLFPNIPCHNVIAWIIHQKFLLKPIRIIKIIKKINLLDNAPYLSIQENKLPSKYVINQGMKRWVEDNNRPIPFSPDLRTYQLFELIECFKYTGKIYRIDKPSKCIATMHFDYLCTCVSWMLLKWHGSKIKPYARKHTIRGDLSNKTVASKQCNLLHKLTGGTTLVM